MSDALPHRMLLVVDHDLLAQSLAKVLGGGSEEVDRRRSDLGAGVLDAVRDGAHEVVLLDLDPWSERPDLQGLVGHLDAGGTPVVALAGDAGLGRLALEGGASGVIRKDQPAGALRKTVADALQADG